MDNVVVLYHAGCSDGLGASWSFRKKYPDAQFIAVRHDGTIPEGLDGKNVFIVDFCYSPEILLEMKKVAKSLLVLDHHKSAMEKCGFDSHPGILGGEVVFAGTRVSVANIREWMAENGRNEIKADFADLTDMQLDLAEIAIFDMKRSGAGMAWDYCFPGTERPWILAYTEDKDLWQFALHNSLEVNAALQSYPLTFEAFVELSVRTIESLVVEGATILRANRNMIDGIVKKAREVEICGYRVMSANSPIFQSEVANILAYNKPFAAVFFVNEKGEKIYSLRSQKNGIDVSIIASYYGGGGHKHSSGFRIGKNEKIEEEIG